MCLSVAIIVAKNYLCVRMYRLKDDILAKAVDTMSADAGFVQWGCTDSSVMPPSASERLEAYLASGYNGDMEYMSRNLNMRLRPFELDGRSGTLLMFLAPYPAVSVISENCKVASYAKGGDYHFVLKAKLNAIMDGLAKLYPDFEGRAFTDSAPILERAFAVEAGLGFIGHNGMLINPVWGNRTLIASILCNLEMEAFSDGDCDGASAIAGIADGNPGGNGKEQSAAQKRIIRADRCGSCRKCIDACPSGAIVRPFVVDARRCISYQTIESRKGYDREMFRISRNGWIFGCDECLMACPWYRRAPGSGMNEFSVNAECIDSMSAGEWMAMGSGEFRRKFASSPMSRAGLRKIKDNVAACGEISESTVSVAEKQTAE